MAFLTRALDPSKTLPYYLDGISPDPEHPICIRLRYIGPGNEKWSNAMAKLPPGLRGKALVAAIADLFAEIAMDGWENLVEDGAVAVFSVDAAKRFVAEILQSDPSVFDRMWRAATNADNFRAPIASAGPLGKG